MNNAIKVKSRIELLSKICDESDETIKHLNVLVSEHVTVRDNEIKKREILERKIVTLNIELDKLTKI